MNRFITPYEALKQGPTAFNDWVTDHPGVPISFKGMDLNNKIFSLSWTEKIERAILRNIDFSGANLHHANFHYTDIEGCNFEGANLTNASFSKVYADRCNFKGANLQNSSFHRGIVDEADFTDADLRQADFTVKSCKNAEMTGARIAGMKFQTTWDGWPWDEWPENLLFAKNLHHINSEDHGVISNFATTIFANFYKDKIVTDDTSEEFYHQVINKIQLITGLFVEPTLPDTLVQVVQYINTELLLKLQQHPELLHKLHWRGFEELVAELLAAFGWYVELTSPTKDNGYDIFAIYKDQSGIRHSWIIECKKYDPSRKVGVEIVRSLYGVKTDLRVGNALLATTSSFTAGVNQFKASRYDLDTKNFTEVVEWVNQYKVRDSGLYIKDNRIELLQNSSKDKIRLPGT